LTHLTAKAELKENTLVKLFKQNTREGKSILNRFTRITRESKSSEKIVVLKRFESVNCESKIEIKHASEAI